MKKIILINIILIIFVYFICDYICFKNNINDEKRANNPLVNNKGYIYNTFYFPIKNFKKAIVKAENGNPDNDRIWYIIHDNTLSTKPSVILYGCSFTVGIGLKINETLSGQLIKLTNRNIYNRGLAGYGIQHSLYHIENILPTLLSKIENKPDTVIYTFIEDHLYRLFKPNDFFDKYLMFYKYNKNNKLIPCSNFDLLFWSSIMSRNFYIKNYQNKEYIFSEERNKYLSDIFLQMNSELKRQIKDVKFVIFVYDGNYLIKEIEKELKNNNIEVIYLSEISNLDFSNEKYRLPNDFHPNALAWEIITPLLVKKLNL